ncbi:hypothetical protein CCAX7_27770 [Capsulimonas corticalis]|uniref:Uncharacterized protein n=1 Tax=Capsulimonas corticalis TaxID=2219043 RepID=A0A402CTI8_9BACT|nr:hypothetical protein [Capsulimonas corticalis]BDI30726.1 hypothetical protein CCAX7_27770 [Capsulimonas corticalis]
MNNYPPPYAQTAPPSGPPKFLIPLLIGILALFGVAIYGGVIAFKAGARTTNEAGVFADRFFGTLSAHQYATAYSMLAPQIQATTTAAEMQDMQGLLEKRHGPVTFARAAGWYINTNNGVTTVTLNYQAQFAGGAKPVNVVVMQTPAGMKIYGYHYNF